LGCADALAAGVVHAVAALTLFILFTDVDWRIVYTGSHAVTAPGRFARGIGVGILLSSRHKGSAGALSRLAHHARIPAGALTADPVYTVP